MHEMKVLEYFWLKSAEDCNVVEYRSWNGSNNNSEINSILVEASDASFLKAIDSSAIGCEFSGILDFQASRQLTKSWLIPLNTFEILTTEFNESIQQELPSCKYFNFLK